MPDPDLEIRGGGGGRRSSRPLERGGGSLQKHCFRSLEPQLGLKIRGGPDPRAFLLDPPLNRQENRTHQREYEWGEQITHDKWSLNNMKTEKALKI